MIIVAGYLRIHPGGRDQFLARSRAAVVAARSAPGCVDFSVSPDLIEEDRVNIMERWDDRASLVRFREEGPDAETGALVRSFHVKEFSLP